MAKCGSQTQNRKASDSQTVSKKASPQWMSPSKSSKKIRQYLLYFKALPYQFLRKDDIEFFSSFSGALPLKYLIFFLKHCVYSNVSVGKIFPGLYV